MNLPRNKSLIEAFHCVKMTNVCKSKSTKRAILCWSLLICISITFCCYQWLYSSFNDAPFEEDKRPLEQRLWDIANYGGIKLFYNRVPKCASSSFITLLLAHHLRHPDYAPEMIRSLVEASNLVRMMRHHDLREKVVIPFGNFGKGFAYEQHVHFINFWSFGRPMPLYINIIREPFSRLMSEYKYHRKTPNIAWNETAFEYPTNTSFISLMHAIYGRNYEYFCGQNPKCVGHKYVQFSLRNAKRNVKKYYLVVGITEEFDHLAEVLEFLLPKQFNKLSEYSERMKIKINVLETKKQIASNITTLIEDDLHPDIQFYNWIKRRFLRLHDLISEAQTRKRATLLDLLKSEHPTDIELLKEIASLLPNSKFWTYGM